MSLKCDLKINDEMKKTYQYGRFRAILNRAGFKDDEVNTISKNVDLSTNKLAIDYINNLITENNVSVYKIAKKTGLNERYLYKILNNQKPLSKEILFSLSFFFELSEEEVTEFLKIRGLSLSNTISDRLFLDFIKKKSYRLEDYVIACRMLADATKTELPDFFGLMKEYRNGTINHK